jgi:hypothetical protein
MGQLKYLLDSSVNGTADHIIVAFIVEYGDGFVWRNKAEVENLLTQSLQALNEVVASVERIYVWVSPSFVH